MLFDRVGINLIRTATRPSTSGIRARPPKTGARVLAATPVVLLSLIGCTLLSVAESRWKVDIVNGADPLLIMVTTDSAAWAWYVPAHASMVLLDELDAAREGQISLVDPLRDCRVLDTVDLPLRSFTIRPQLVVAEPPDYRIEMADGATLRGPASTDYFGGCSG